MCSCFAAGCDLIFIGPALATLVVGSCFTAGCDSIFIGPALAALIRFTGSVGSSFVESCPAPISDLAASAFERVSLHVATNKHFESKTCRRLPAPEAIAKGNPGDVSQSFRNDLGREAFLGEVPSIPKLGDFLKFFTPLATFFRFLNDLGDS